MSSDQPDTPVPPEPDYAALIAAGERVTATGERVTGQFESLRAELAAAEARAITRVAAAEARGAEHLKSERDKRRRSQRRTRIAIGFDVLLTVVVATILNSQADTNRRIQESLRQNYITQAQQAQTRVRVLCPLYEVLLGVASDPARSTGMTEAQQARSAAAVKVIEEGYATLGCPPLSKQ